MEIASSYPQNSKFGRYLRDLHTKLPYFGARENEEALLRLHTVSCSSKARTQSPYLPI